MNQLGRKDNAFYFINILAGAIASSYMPNCLVLISYSEGHAHLYFPTFFSYYRAMKDEKRYMKDLIEQMGKTLFDISQRPLNFRCEEDRRFYLNQKMERSYTI